MIIDREKDTEQLTLEGCICGGCVFCPDGWHYNSELLCICTPDCILMEKYQE